MSRVQADGKPTAGRQIAIRTLQKDYLSRVVYHFDVPGSSELSNHWVKECDARGEYKISWFRDS